MSDAADRGGNVAYLDPPYSLYFHRLARRVAARRGGEVRALLSSPAYEMYCGDDERWVWPPGARTGAAAPPEEGRHALWSQPADDERFRAAFAHAAHWLGERFREQGIGVCLVFSDARPFSLAAAVAARECGVQCLYFERGAFRMRSASLSTQGLNARFSLAAARALPGIAGAAPQDIAEARAPEPWLRLRFLRFIVANELACRAAPQRRWMQHKRYALAPYARLALAQWWVRRGAARGVQVGRGWVAGAPLVLVPMQLPADSQFRLYAPFASNQEFIDFVARAVRAAGARLLLKRHPMDSARYRLPEGAHWVAGNLVRLYPLHPVVVCINSTVGFEAATRGLAVICFGPSFYTESDAVARAGRNDFAAVLAACLRAPPPAGRGAALLADVLHGYQAPGDTWGYTEADLDATAEIAIAHLRAAEGGGHPG